MSEVWNQVEKAADERPANGHTTSRRQFVAATAAAVGSMGLLGVAGGRASAHHAPNKVDSTQDILNVATSAEVLATIVNTVGFHRGLGGDPVTQRNIKAAAREELLHFKALRSFGGKPASRRVWVPDAVFASRKNFLNTLQVGDQIFVNAYLVATKAFGEQGEGELALVAAEFMGVEAVHRALARQSLGLLGNDRVFMKFDQRETAPGAPNRGQRGFDHISHAVDQLLAAGFNFGAQGAKPGRFFDFDRVRERTPNDRGLNTFTADTD
jgi:Ferritin-like domain